MRTESQMSPVVRRIQSIAKAEFRTFDGQLAAMLALWQQEHGAAPVKSVGRKPKSIKPKARSKVGQGMKDRRHSAESRRKISEALRLSHAKRRLKKHAMMLADTTKLDVVAS